MSECFVINNSASINQKFLFNNHLVPSLLFISFLLIKIVSHKLQEFSEYIPKRSSDSQSKWTKKDSCQCVFKGFFMFLSLFLTHCLENKNSQIFRVQKRNVYSVFLPCGWLWCHNQSRVFNN